MFNVSISTNKLTVGYRVQNTEYRVQTDLDFALLQGEMVCMLGPNGCGKSTLLRTLAGLQPALSGEYSIQNTEYRAEKSVALVLTERLSMDNTTVHDVVALGRYPYSSFLDGLKEADELIIDESLKAVGFNNAEVANTFFTSSEKCLISDFYLYLCFSLSNSWNIFQIFEQIWLRKIKA